MLSLVLGISVLPVLRDQPCDLVQRAAERSAEFREQMTEGDEFWGFFEREHQTDAAFDAVDYGQAYAIHPRNREAVAARKKAA